MYLIFLLATIIGASSFDTLNNNFQNGVQIVQSNVMEGVDMVQQWIKFQRDFFKNYSQNDSPLRFEIFKQNFARIKEHNRQFLQGLQTFKIAINNFADLTKEEFVQTLKLKPPSRRFKRHNYNNSGEIRRRKCQTPEYLDWRERGAVTHVKNQQDCGSCWSFSALGAVEGQMFLKRNQNTPLSEQHLIDCNTDDTNVGCVGGWMSNAFEYLKYNFVTSENEYPYQGQQQQCMRGNNFETRVSVTGYQNLQGDENSLKQAVASVGPISAALDASNLQFYGGGVYRDEECSPTNVNHGVLVVGYGNDNGRDYWIVKNSWGAQWGENGYFRIIRNSNNQCNLATYAMYPILG